ncbi:MAG: response regulator [Alphaproteobacteria bacterium]|nr:response regulator [Alphaproteobacteria bacterium]
MLKVKTHQRPDRQLEKMLIGLVYALISIVLSILMLFIFPAHSLMFLVLTIITATLSILMAIMLISESERALTYGEFANIILESKDVISRIDNAHFDALIENKLAAKVFQGERVLNYLEKRIFQDKTNELNLERLIKAVETLKEENVLLELEHKDAHTWYEVHLRPIYLKKNDIFQSDFSIEKIQKETYFLWQIKDVTAIQNTDKILEQERQKMHRFIEDMPLGLYVLDENGCFEYVNNTFAMQLQTKKSNLMGKRFETYVQNKQSEILDVGKIEFSGLLFFQNEKQNNFELFVTQNRTNEGDLVKTRGLTLQDLPGDAKLNEALNKYASYCKLLLNSVPVGVISVFKSDKIQSFNARAVDILGTTLKNASLSAFFNSADVAKLKKLYADYLSGTPDDLPVKFETTLKNGKTVLLEMAPYWQTYLKQSHFAGVLIYFSDTTERKNLEEQFAQAQKMQAMGQFAGGIAHDFNNLLTAIIGFCDLLLQRHRIGDPSFADLNEIKQNAIRAAALVRQLLVYSKQQPTNPKYLDVVESLTDLSGFLKRIMGEQINLSFYHDNDLGYIRIDPVHFTQVIMNLSVNAKDAMSGKGNLKISTRVETLLKDEPFGADVVKAGDYVVISVSDTGCGIKQENLSRIFDPFFSTKQNAAGTGSGTGLGLATVYGIVSQSKGLIKVESVESKGTTFKIYLPRYETGDKENKTDDEVQSLPLTPILNGASQSEPKLIFGLNVTKTDQQSGVQKNASDVKILFVEDEDSVRMFGIRALKKKGFSVTPCASAEAALEESGPFDLLITDMVMPGLSGAELSKEMKKRQPDIKIILASGYSEEMARKELNGEQDFTFISKPYSLGDLIKKVFDVLSE